MVRETYLNPKDFVLPLFVIEGKNRKEEIQAMPGQFRFSTDQILEQCKKAYDLGIPGVALFPAVEDQLKDSFARESTNLEGLLPSTVMEIKNSIPDLTVITDVAMDPYSSDGHDGVVHEGQILNDPTIKVLSDMALTQAQAGADIIAPSDMMDGRVKVLRETLDENGFSEVGILAYSAKYASSFYGPFRDALESAPKSGDKKTYQMDPANRREALREVFLDIKEGADMVMVKPALSYLDVISDVKRKFTVPIAAYNVSGEYSMIKFAAKAGAINEKTARDEMLLSIKRAGADIILSYFALDFAEDFKKNKI
jgi:porphobilinogen synthase